MEKRNCDQLGGVRLDLSEARMGKAESRYRAGFWPLSRHRFDLEPSLLPPLPFNALDDELATITPVSGLVSTQSSGWPTLDLSPFRTYSAVEQVIPGAGKSIGVGRAIFLSATRGPQTQAISV